MNNGLPGIGTARTATPRRIFATEQGKVLLPGSNKIISGAESRDPLNTGDLDVLRAGLVMGKVTASGEYAPSIIGLTSEALDSDETTLTVSAATAVELVRRIGASGTFKLAGPPTAAGTVRVVTVTYSAIDTATGVITMTAIGVSSVWTLTETDGTDGGTFRIKVTNPDGDFEITDALAYNVSAADMELAVEALTIVGTDNGTCSGNAGGPYTITFNRDLGNMIVEVIDDFTNDGGVYEGGITVAQTAEGVDGRMVASAIIMDTDGTETPKTLIPDGYGIKVTDDDGTSIDVPFPEIPVAGVIDASQIINYPSDASLKAWLKAQLRTHCPGFVFDDDF